MATEKVTFRIEEEKIEMLKTKYAVNNQSEAIRLAITESVMNGGFEEIKTLFPYIGKKPPRICREVVEAFRQSGCKIFVDLFCGSLSIL